MLAGVKKVFQQQQQAEVQRTLVYQQTAMALGLLSLPHLAPESFISAACRVQRQLLLKSLPAQRLSLIATTSKWKALVKTVTNETHHHRFAIVTDEYCWFSGSV